MARKVPFCCNNLGSSFGPRVRRAQAERVSLGMSSTTVLRDVRPAADVLDATIAYC